MSLLQYEELNRAQGVTKETATVHMLLTGVQLHYKAGDVRCYPLKCFMHLTNMQITGVCYNVSNI